LIELPDFDYDTGFVPFQWVGSNLVLDADVVANFEWWKALGVFRPSFQVPHVSISEGCFA
jgi:hypothetical protein